LKKSKNRLATGRAGPAFCSGYHFVFAQPGPLTGILSGGTK